MQCPHGSELRLRDPRLGEPPAHRNLVRHQVRGLAADPREAEFLGHGGDHGDGAIGGNGEHAVDRVPPADLRHAGDVGEVDDLRDVGNCEPRCVRVPVHGDDAHA